MYLATLETRNFRFEAFGNTRAAARGVLRSGWAEHRAQNGDHVMPWRDVRGDVHMREVLVGQCWRDGDQVLVYEVRVPVKQGED